MQLLLREKLHRRGGCQTFGNCYTRTNVIVRISRQYLLWVRSNYIFEIHTLQRTVFVSKPQIGEQMFWVAIIYTIHIAISDVMMNSKRISFWIENDSNTNSRNPESGIWIINVWQPQRSGHDFEYPARIFIFSKVIPSHLPGLFSVYH